MAEVTQPSASELLRALELRIEALLGRINDGFPAVSSGHDDPMIDGVGALSELEDELTALPALVELVEAAQHVSWELPDVTDGSAVVLDESLVRLREALGG